MSSRSKLRDFARILCPIYALMLLPVLCPQISFSQNTPAGYRKQAYPLNAEEGHKVDALKEKVDLPDLPAYSGKSKFVGGYVEAGAKGGTRYDMTFEAEESESQILDWYDNVFRMYKWKKIDRAQTSVSASHKEGHYATVSTNSVLLKDGKTRCRISLHYKLAVK